MKTIGDVFTDVAKNRADYGVVPVENSTEGVVNHTLDMFIDSELKIVAQIILPIQHCLLSKATRRDQVKRLYSHPQALAQCRQWVQLHLPAAEIIEASSTTRAAELAARNRNAGAIASSLAADRYRLRILEADIQDNSTNATRFLVLGRQCGSPTGRDRTSFIFSVVDEVGSLHRALAPLSRTRST
jgi:chorismate mutase/prephenate dehydratase